MRFLIDECLSIGLAPLLNDSGHDAAHVNDRDLAGHDDEDVMTCAVDEVRVLVSADTDFGEILARTSGRAPSVILFRRSDRSAEALHRVLMDNLEAVAADLEVGAFVVLAESRIRVRRLPLR